jgi:H+-translocating NAD(P) transhydrogenase subunit beta
MIYHLAQFAYIVASALFVLSLYWMNSPKTARKSVMAGVAAMLLAVLATWVQPAITNHLWIILAIVAGFIVGVPLSRVPLTAVPQRTALSHAFGGLAAGLVGTAKYYLWTGEGSEQLTGFRMAAIVAEVILGFLTFTGSLMAAGKLQEIKWIPQRPVTYPLQNVSNIGLLTVALLLGILLVVNPTGPWAAFAFPAIIVLALMFGILLIIPIGGADMPTVISILNSYAGLSAVAMGFVLDNKLLIVAGALDGSSGLILSIIMCKAMNRSFTNVLFGAFGTVQAAKAGAEQKAYKSETIEGAAQMLEQASSVVIIPGYGMAVAQAQHRIRELYDNLKKRGVSVKFAIHPVAGRMPGHMNVLLAEADIPYEISPMTIWPRWTTSTPTCRNLTWQW